MIITTETVEYEYVGYCHLPHGWNTGGLIKSDIAPTIDSGIRFWHTLIVVKEKEKNNSNG